MCIGNDTTKNTLYSFGSLVCQSLASVGPELILVTPTIFYGIWCVLKLLGLGGQVVGIIFEFLMM